MSNISLSLNMIDWDSTDINNKFIINGYGIDNDGNNIGLKITDFKPEYFIRIKDREDIDLTYMTSKGERTSKVSTIISTMIHHAAEHRTQIVAALDKNNVRTINLDNYSPWSLIG